MMKREKVGLICSLMHVMMCLLMYIHYITYLCCCRWALAHSISVITSWRSRQTDCDEASGVAMFKAFLAARVWGMRLILGAINFSQTTQQWDLQSATSKFLQNPPRLHWWFMNSSALGTFPWFNVVQAWDMATSPKISKHLVPSFLYLWIHPGVFGKVVNNPFL